ncbi:UDP-N-acetylglucosamine--dolichyl-phosphate N-acetylglucosaminephosphotransferase [Anthonomus grandis grandis]|uniref:UDP-N-acetylglucosamine--dolichyl-phosphate N-acetylglucosaminephosphotransferase n=1 Tax=Anthonomus grandis grandis TaxID=2921223 RepID=UPI002165DBF5|nr:UDP-N-acetylglucosamine--dolichyl-phosphate N-acetylglucosaminephosphotransferase [Anthonomus grandis grandis]
MAVDVDVDNEIENSMKIMFPIMVNIGMAALSYALTVRTIPKLKEKFIKANLFGIDMSKTTSDKVPESLGIVSGFIFLITLVLFIPVAFGNNLLQKESFPYDEYVKCIVALLSICCMLLLGFADDVLDVPWRQKLLLPTIASLPLLTVYYVSFNMTTIIVPKPFRDWFGVSVDIGIIYYLYMGMFAVFCTNAINILAGVNGLEAGQSVVIAISIAIFNFVELTGPLWKAHQFSLYFMLPYIGTSLALLKHNWYPASVFVGDTFCYFSGMTFAVVAILGHFSKTALLFFMPQVFNFIYSVPQLFKFIPCPRHRLPKFNSKTDKMECSTTVFKYNDLRFLGKLAVNVFRTFKLIRWEEKGGVVVTNNFTLINLVLLYCGPMHEARLTTVLLVIQMLCTGLAFLIRYPFASVFYDV